MTAEVFFQESRSFHLKLQTHEMMQLQVPDQTKIIQKNVNIPRSSNVHTINEKILRSNQNKTHTFLLCCRSLSSSFFKAPKIMDGIFNMPLEYIIQNDIILMEVTLKTKRPWLYVHTRFNCVFHLLTNFRS